MKKYFLVLLLLMLCQDVFANSLIFGVEVNALGIDEKSYMGNKTSEIVRNLRGDIVVETSYTFIFGVYEGYYVNNYFSIIAKQRYFSVRNSVDFPLQKSMNFELSKHVVPLNIGAKLRLKLDEIFGFYFDVLPGMYIVDSFEKGFFGSYHNRDISFGGSLGLGIEFVIKEMVGVGIGGMYEWFPIPQNNIILEDGGDGGGFGLGLRIGAIF